VELFSTTVKHALASHLIPWAVLSIAAFVWQVTRLAQQRLKASPPIEDDEGEGVSESDANALDVSQPKRAPRRGKTKARRIRRDAVTAGTTAGTRESAPPLAHTPESDRRSVFASLPHHELQGSEAVLINALVRTNAVLINALVTQTTGDPSHQSNLKRKARGDDADVEASGSRKKKKAKRGKSSGATKTKMLPKRKRSAKKRPPATPEPGSAKKSKLAKKKR
jgi:hypothetical protein